MKLTRRRIRKKSSRVKRRKVGRKTKNRRKRRRRKNVGGGRLRGSRRVHPTSTPAAGSSTSTPAAGSSSSFWYSASGGGLVQITYNEFKRIKASNDYNFLYKGGTIFRHNKYIPHGIGRGWWRPAQLRDGSTATPHSYSGNWMDGCQGDSGVHYDGHDIVHTVGVTRVTPIY